MKPLLIAVAALAVVGGVVFGVSQVTSEPQPTSLPSMSTSPECLTKKSVVPRYYNPAPIAEYQITEFACESGYVAFQVEEQIGTNPIVIRVTLLRNEGGTWSPQPVGKGAECPFDAPREIHRIVC